MCFFLNLLDKSTGRFNLWFHEYLILHQSCKFPTTVHKVYGLPGLWYLHQLIWNSLTHQQCIVSVKALTLHPAEPHYSPTSKYPLFEYPWDQSKVPKTFSTTLNHLTLVLAGAQKDLPEGKQRWGLSSDLILIPFWPTVSSTWKIQ